MHACRQAASAPFSDGSSSAGSDRGCVCSLQTGMHVDRPFSAGGWAIQTLVTLHLYEDLAGSPQTGEDVLTLCLRSTLWCLSRRGERCTPLHACTDTAQSHMDACSHVTSTHACMQTCHSHMDACRHATHTWMHVDTPLTHTCMQTRHSHMHACRHATHTWMHADTPLTHACMQTRPPHMHADMSPTHACMQTRHSHMHACRHATHTCMQTRHSHFRVSTKVYVLQFLVTRVSKQTRSKYIQFTVHGKQTCQFYA